VSAAAAPPAEHIALPSTTTNHHGRDDLRSCAQAPSGTSASMFRGRVGAARGPEPTAARKHTTRGPREGRRGLGIETTLAPSDIGCYTLGLRAAAFDGRLPDLHGSLHARPRRRLFQGERPQGACRSSAIRPFSTRACPGSSTPLFNAARLHAGHPGQRHDRHDRPPAASGVDMSQMKMDGLRAGFDRSGGPGAWASRT